MVNPESLEMRRQYYQLLHQQGELEARRHLREAAESLEKFGYHVECIITPKENT